MPVWILATWALLASHQQHERTVFRAVVEAVQVDVYVGRNGEPIAGLTADDFELFDNGIRQRFELVEIQSIPLNILLTLDTSESVAGTKLRHLQAAAHAFLSGLDEEDRAGLITFNHRVRRASPLTEDLAGVHEAIDRVEAFGGTKWHDALFAGVKTVEAVASRPVVVLFTDGEDTYSWLREDQLPPLMRQSNAILYVIHGREELPPLPETEPHSPSWQRSQARARGEDSRRSRMLRELADIGGGRFIAAGTAERLQEVFTEVLTELETRYLLVYHPSAEIAGEGWHDIKVELTRRNAEVRARHGYFQRRSGAVLPGPRGQ